MTLSKALAAMGYRKLDNATNKWGKPIGYMLYVVEVITEYKAVFTAWFKDAQGKLSVYERHEFDYVKNITDNAIGWLKFTECYARHDVNPHLRVGTEVSEFEFVTPEQWAEYGD